MGCTALGPALVTSLALAARLATEAEVFLCTDGLPNKGIGRLDGMMASSGFYTNIGERAKQHGAVIRIIGTEGNNSQLELVSQCAIVSGGSVLTLDPSELARQIRVLSQDELVARNVLIDIRMPAFCHIKNDVTREAQSSTLKLDVGNVTSKADLAIAFEVDKDTPVDKTLNLQVIITFTGKDGSR